MRLRKPSERFLGAAGAVLVALAIVTGAPARAQQGAAAGFNLNASDEPVRIEADVLEVLDDQGTAVFTGKVVAQQGDTTLNTTKLTVFYEGGAMAKQANEASGDAASGGPAQSQRIKRLEAEGQVVVTTKDQRATGDKAIFRMEDNSVTLTGDVVLSQGKNVLRGTELIVDLDTGRSKLVSNDSSGQPSRVSGMFLPGSTPGPNRQGPQ